MSPRKKDRLVSDDMLGELDRKIDGGGEARDRINELMAEFEGQIAAVFSTGAGPTVLRILRETTIERPIALSHRYKDEPLQEDLFMAFRTGQNSIVLRILAAQKRSEAGS